jgi:hypothetical protein
LQFKFKKEQRVGAVEKPTDQFSERAQRKDKKYAAKRRLTFLNRSQQSDERQKDGDVIDNNDGCPKLVLE